MPRWSSVDPAADRRLVNGLNEGDEDSLASLYELYAERIYDYCLTMTSDAKVSADIVHDTFIDAYRRAPRMRDRVHLRPWLYAAARRRCLQRGRGRGLFWEWGIDSTDQPDGVPRQQVRELLEAALARLDNLDQETLTLVLRHDLRGADLAAALGLSQRRAGTRVSRAKVRFQAAFTAELRSSTRRCAAAGLPAGPARRPGEAEAELNEHTTGHDADPYISGDKVLERHIDGCTRCRHRSRIKAPGLFALPSAPVLPAALRYRVVHTGSDPELAGHRADIAARGGGLTPGGLPRQPDVPSPFTRRWLFAGGGVIGALVTVLAALLLVGSPLAGPWPFHPKPLPSKSGLAQNRPERTGGRSSEEPSPSQPPPVGGAPASPQVRGPAAPIAPPTRRPPDPPPANASPPAPAPPRPPGALSVDQSIAVLGGDSRTTQIRLTAAGGQVTWQATASSPDITITPPNATTSAEETTEVTVTLKEGPLRLPGQSQLTFTGESGQALVVTVRWPLYVL